MSGQRFPPVIVVSGGVEFIRVRLVQRIVQDAKKCGRRVVSISAGDETALCELFSGGFLFADATLAVIESAQQRKRVAAKSKKKDTSSENTSGWSEEALAMVIDHAKDGESSDIALVIHHDGEAGPNTFAGQVAEVLPKAMHKVAATPKPWEEKGYATKFLMTELRNRGKSIPEPLAEQVVRKVGTDVGLLSFEALKFSTSLDVDGRSEVTPQDAVALMAAFGAEDWEMLKSALAARNVKLVVRTWNDIRNGPGGEAVQKAISILTSTIVKWVHAAALHEAGVPPDDAAARVGMHPYSYKTTILPAALRWGRTPLEDLLRSVVEVGVRKGHINPWVALESALIQACGSGR